MEGGAANYIGSTPVFTFNNTQRALDRLYQQQQYQQAYNQKLYQQNAALLQKQIEGVRAADTPQITQAYNNWANLQKELIANPNLAKQNPNLYAQYKQATDQAESDIWRLTAQSKETAKTLNDINEDATKNWVNYDDNAHTLIAQTHNMSSDQIAQNGLNDYNTYRYKGTNYDFNKDINNAIGKGKQVKVLSGEDGVNDVFKNYTVYNTPQEIYSSLGANASREFLKAAKALQDKDMSTGHYQAVVDEFNNLKDENGLWGLKDKNIKVDPNDPITYLTALATLKAQPEQNSDTKEANKNRELQAQQQKSLELEQQRHQNRMSEDAFANNLKKELSDYKQANSNKQQGKVLDAAINKIYNSGEGTYNANIQGKTYKATIVHLPSEVAQKYAKLGADGKTFEYPKEYLMTTDKKYIIPIYTNDNGNISNKKIFSSTTANDIIPIENFKTDFGDLYLSQKEFTNELGSDEGVSAGNDGIPDFLRK